MSGDEQVLFNPAPPCPPVLLMVLVLAFEDGKDEDGKGSDGSSAVLIFARLALVNISGRRASVMASSIKPTNRKTR